MNESTPRYWFPAKRYGWGWGAPTVWQGWAVLVAYVVLLGAAPFFFPLRTRLPGFLISTAVLTIALLLICFAKGEPPRWRWGGRD